MWLRLTVGHNNIVCDLWTFMQWKNFNTCFYWIDVVVGSGWKGSPGVIIYIICTLYTAISGSGGKGAVYPGREKINNIIATVGSGPCSERRYYARSRSNGRRNGKITVACDTGGDGTTSTIWNRRVLRKYILLFGTVAAGVL